MRCLPMHVAGTGINAGLSEFRVASTPMNRLGGDRRSCGRLSANRCCVFGY
eukprot:CAMPEP_0177391434 /NCGR_PEP_ID=MMETSP0368-20130122/53778_1 /TAXON_ID=447022 ORGANISM="Scrippsiella hangoei-like, Strain SHHI-4" /NCGR_SAMPLE_ID=MMETSP0368 /ASSEMBLY_ACC=CAM_ASM_000363 /LENGTH=50 /DNA_ID=CAMNT_0018857275 /DNA_START=152 /DNA_END=301 /DNA_ORIENTATION=+